MAKVINASRRADIFCALYRLPCTVSLFNTCCVIIVFMTSEARCRATCATWNMNWSKETQKHSTRFMFCPASNRITFTTYDDILRAPLFRNKLTTRCTGPTKPLQWIVHVRWHYISEMCKMRVRSSASAGRPKCARITSRVNTMSEIPIVGPHDPMWMNCRPFTALTAGAYFFGWYWPCYAFNAAKKVKVNNCMVDGFSHRYIVNCNSTLFTQLIKELIGLEMDIRCENLFLPRLAGRPSRFTRALSPKYGIAGNAKPFMCVNSGYFKCDRGSGTV